MLEPMLNELRQEAATTRRVLEHVPGDKLSWKPHQKSMSLGQLALHVASIPSQVTGLAQLEEFDASQADFDPPEAKSVAEILAVLDASVTAADEYLEGFDDKTATANMPFDERLAQRVRNILAEECPAKERRMFGGLAFMVNGHMCCGIMGKDLVVRVGADAHKYALAQPHTRTMDFTGRPMKGFVYVERLGYRTSASLRTWIRFALGFVLSLPPKVKSASSSP